MRCLRSLGRPLCFETSVLVTHSPPPGNMSLLVALVVTWCSSRWESIWFWVTMCSYQVSRQREEIAFQCGNV